MTEKKNVMIKIITSRIELNRSFFDDEEELEDFEDEEFASLGEMPEPTEIWMEGRMVIGKGRVELVYEESELSGMEGSVTSIGFDRAVPGLISMMRSGMIRTALVFEENKRHICVYRTPFSAFEVCTIARRVKNHLLTEGLIELDYLIEVHGAQAERCYMTISVHEVENQL